MNSPEEAVAKLAKAIKNQRRARDMLRASRHDATDALRELREAGVSWATIAMKLGHALNTPLSASKRVTLADALRKRTQRARPTEHLPAEGSTPDTRADRSAALEQPTRRTIVTEEFRDTTESSK